MGRTLEAVVNCGNHWKWGAVLGAFFILVSAPAGAVTRAASPTALANTVLALPQRKPCDVNLFTSKFQPGDWPGLYPEGSPMQPAAGAVPSEAQVRSQLATFLGGSSGGAATLGLFDRADVKTKLPDPTLRAALLSLRGTVAEPVIEYLLTRTTDSAPPRFGGLGPQALGRSAGAPGQSRTQIILNVRHRSEHFALLGPIFAHEILHHDLQANYPEEVILNALTAVVHMQLVSRHPELATSGTELSRYMNEWVLEFMNSRAPGSSRSAIVVKGGKGVALGSGRNAPDFWTFWTKVYRGQIRGGTLDTLPAPPVFATVLRKLLASGVAIAKPPRFSRKTAELFSRLNDTWLSPVERVRISVLLGLVSVDEIVRATQLTRLQAVKTFRLGSSKTACG